MSTDRDEAEWELAWIDGPGWDRERDDDDAPEVDGPPPKSLTPKDDDDDFDF